MDACLYPSRLAEKASLRVTNTYGQTMEDGTHALTPLDYIFAIYLSNE